MLINAYIRDGKLQEAFQLHDEMLNKGIGPDDTTKELLNLDVSEADSHSSADPENPILSLSS
jgi:pentatricopeptide repeat protein